MKKTGKRKFYGDTLIIRELVSQCNEWQFLFLKDTAFLALSKSVFVTDGDLIILRPKEKCSLPKEFTAYKCVAVSDGFVKKTLDLFSPALADKWQNAESLIISLGGGGEEFYSLLNDAINANDGYSRTFMIKQVIVSCIAETVRKDKYGQQALPSVVIESLELMKKPEILAGSFAEFRKKAGMSEEDIFKAVTSTPAKALGKEKEWGYLAVGRRADIAVFDYTDEGFDIVDRQGNRFQSDMGYRCVFTVLDGQIVYKY